MSARRPHHYLARFLMVLLPFTLLVATPHGFAQDAMEPEVNCFAGVISGTCFHDTNRNGIRDNADGGVADITLSLKRINLLFRQTEVGITVSDAEGRYEFMGLQRGYYLVEAQSTAQWECSSKNPQLVIVARFIESKERDIAFQKSVVQDSFVLNEFQYNSNDTHMYWDGTYLWLPEAEYLDNDNRYSANLIRLNPDNFSYKRYNLPQIDYNEEDTYPIVYEVVPSPGNSDTLYIIAPCGQPKSIYVFSKSNELADGFRLINEEEFVYGGTNGAKMAVTTTGGNDTVWITANDSKIATFDVVFTTMTGLYDFSSIAPSGLYGIAAVPTATSGTYLLHVASFSGKLLIFPSNLSSVNQSITLDVADYGIRDAGLTALTYDEQYIWVAGHGKYNGRVRFFVMRYTPASQYDVAGECTFYWSHVSVGAIPSIVSYGNWVFAVVEDFGCYSRYVIRLNKTTGVVDNIEIKFQNTRIASSLGYDNNGNIYVGGYGCRSETIRPLELVRFKADGE